MSTKNQSNRLPGMVQAKEINCRVWGEGYVGVHTAVPPAPPPREPHLNLCWRGTLTIQNSPVHGDSGSLSL